MFSRIEHDDIENRIEAIWRGSSGQSSVEAAFMVPILFIVLMILLQPGIVLYDRMVMNAAAAEGCRYLATFTPSQGMNEARAKEIIGRRLGSIPEQDLFHVHNPCSYQIELSGQESSETVSVKITNALKPLPLIGAGASAFGMLDDRGCFVFSVESHAPTQPEWAQGAEGGPDSWVHAREDGR